MDCPFFPQVPQYSLEVLIRAFGGTVSWSGIGGVGGVGPYKEESKEITHHVVDRPHIGSEKLSRHYVQPQWVYDCVNARQLLPTSR